HTEREHRGHGWFVFARCSLLFCVYLALKVVGEGGGGGTRIRAQSSRVNFISSWGWMEPECQQIGPDSSPLRLHTCAHTQTHTHTQNTTHTTRHAHSQP